MHKEPQPVLAAAHAAPSCGQILLHFDAPVYLGYLREHVPWSRVGQGQTLLMLKLKMKHLKIMAEIWELRFPRHE